LPTTLTEAIDHFEADEVIHNALGVEYAEMYIRAKREEWNAYHRSISQWELDNYLTVY
jgi:glutamine synthetase